MLAQLETFAKLLDNGIDTGRNKEWDLIKSISNM